MFAKILLIIYIILINFLGIAAMASDKIRAMEHRLRIPESVLITISVIGGSLGALAGLLLFHHKTRRTSLRIAIPLILAAQIGLIILLRSVMTSIVFL